MVTSAADKFQKKTLVQQGQRLRHDFPDSEYKTKQGNFLVWEGWVTPREDSKKYLLCVNYSINDKPYIWVVNPALHHDKRRLPHTYAGNRLCLYLPKEWRWEKSEWISTTIVPWACLWLYFFEIWEITEEWLGGGKHPGEEDNNTVKKPVRKIDKFKKQKKKVKKDLSRIECVRLSDI